MTSKEIVLPDYLKDLVDDSSKNLVSVTGSVPRISLKGGKFRLILDGEEVERINDKMHVVILGTQPERGMAKTFYKGKYDPNESGPPDCSSTDGVKPDSWVNDPQNSRCADCPNNAWGSATGLSGKKAKACRDSKRLMVVKAQEIGDPEATIYILNVTVASLKSLSAYGKLLVENRVPMAAAITTLVMDDESDFPRLDFEFAGVLKEEKGKQSMLRAAKKEWTMFESKAIAHDGDNQKKLEKKEIDPEELEQGKSELVDDKDDTKEAPMTDVDDLLDGWDD